MCPEFSSVTPISWTETLFSVKIRDVKLLEKFEYSKSSSDGVNLYISGKDDLHSLDQVLVFNKETGIKELTLSKCPPQELRHHLMLTSLKRLIAYSCDGLVGLLGVQGDVEWQLPVERLEVHSCGATGRELTELLAHLPRLSELEINGCGMITQLVVGVDRGAGEGRRWGAALPGPSLRHATGAAYLQMPRSGPGGSANSSSPAMPPEARNMGLPQVAIRRLVFLSFLSPFPILPAIPRSHLSNLTSLTRLGIWRCGEDLRCEGLLPLLTTGGHLSELDVDGPRFFAGWDPRSEVLQVQGGGQEQQLQLVSPPSPSTLRELSTSDAAGLLTAPICSFLSSSLTELALWRFEEMERFTKEQEDMCPAVRSLPKDGLPKSLQELDVKYSHPELKQQCRGLVGTIPKIRL